MYLIMTKKENYMKHSQREEEEVEEVDVEREWEEIGVKKSGLG